MPVPSRKARDGTAATKPPCVVAGRFCSGRPFFGRAAVRAIEYQAESPPRIWRWTLEPRTSYFLVSGDNLNSLQTGKAPDSCVPRRSCDWQVGRKAKDQ